MDTVISLLVLSVLPQLVVPEVPTAPFRAVAEIVSGDSRIFSGDSVQLKCSVPDEKSTWGYLWFKGSEQLPQTGEHFTLWRANAKASGKFHCQGVRGTVVGDIVTLPSVPIEIKVDGGWAIMQVPPRHSLVGDTLQVTCRVRLTPPLQEVILYKDGVETMRQRGPNSHVFYLTNSALTDRGMYSCRASWDVDSRTRSVISAEAEVVVLEILSQPILKIVADNNLVPANMLKLTCEHEYNAPAPAPPVNYYFYKDNKRLGTAKSDNSDLVMRSPGQFSCRVRVPELDLSRWSEPTTFGRVRGPQMTAAIGHHDVAVVAAPPVFFPDLSLPTAANPRPARPSPPLLKSPSTLLPTFQPLYQTTTPEPQNVEAPGKPDDNTEGSGDMSQDSPDTV